MAATAQMVAVAATSSVVASVLRGSSKTKCDLRLWDLSSGEVLLDGTAPLTTIAIDAAPDGSSLLIVPDNTRIQLVSVPSGERTKPTQLSKNTLAESSGYSLDATRFGVSTCYQLAVWDARTAERVCRHTENPRGRRELTGFALSPDASELVVGVRKGPRMKVEMRLEVYGVPDLELRRHTVLKGHAELELGWNDDGILVGTQGSLALYDAASLKPARKHRVSSRRAMSGDGRRVASMTTRGDKCAVIDLVDGSSTVVFEGDDAASHEARVGITTDGSHVVRGRGDEVAVWRVADGAELWRATHAP